MNTETTNPQFKEFVILELMGHRRLFGLVTEQEIAGHKFLRIECPDGKGKSTTQFYSPTSVYCITPTTEDVVNAAAHNNNPRPVSRYELELPEPSRSDADDDVRDEDLDDDAL